ncbi:MAG: type II toxin-antitoxin system VapC family toxin [Actinomycetota bacterium]
MTYVVDTHALIWFMIGSDRLGPNARIVLSNPDNAFILPAIVLAEACWMVEHGKTPIPSVSAFLESLDEDPRFTLAVIDRVLVQRSATLVAVGEMHDRLVVATALMHSEADPAVSLVTRDENITASKLVRVVW